MKYYSFEKIVKKEDNLRKSLQNLLNKNLIENYYIEDTGDDLLNLMIGFNNVKSFKFK